LSAASEAVLGSSKSRPGSSNVTADSEDYYLDDPDYLSKKLELSPPAMLILSTGKSTVSQFYKFALYSLLFKPNNQNEIAVDENNLFSNSSNLEEMSLLEEKFTKLLGVTQLPDSGIMEFLIMFLLEPITATKKYSFHTKLWMKLLLSFSAVLKTDFELLQDFRMEAGLLTPDINTHSNNSAKAKQKPPPSVRAATPEDATSGAEEDVTDNELDAKEKKRRKKEKERQRRELKKLQNKKNGGDGDDLNDENTIADDNNSNNKDNNPASNTENDADPSKSKEKPIPKLISRVTELLKSGCGVEILNESNSVNELTHRSHFCVAMYSGLNILFTNFKEDTTVSNMFSTANLNEKNHHFELLIQQKEMNEMLSMNGQLGFISAYFPSAENEEGNLVTELLGTQANSTEVKVTRGKWSHISITASKEPTNRMLVYLDGLIIGNFKDCAFPLPMLTAGGSPFNLFSFSGLLLDVRYWDYQRSTRQISDKLHGLIKLTLNKIANNNVQVVNGNGNSSESTDNTAPVLSHFEKQREDRGLIAWWTFEDGPEFDVVTDVTRHRFKTRLINHLDVNYFWNGSEDMKYEIPNYILSDLPFTVLNLKTYMSKLLAEEEQNKGKQQLVKKTPIEFPLDDSSLQIIENTKVSRTSSAVHPPEEDNENTELQLDHPTHASSSPSQNTTAIPSFASSVNNSARNLFIMEEEEEKEADQRMNDGDLEISNVLHEENLGEIDHEGREDDELGLQLDLKNLDPGDINNLSPLLKSRNGSGQPRRIKKQLRSAPQLFYQLMSQYKWIVAESVKSHVSLLAYQLPSSPSTAKVDNVTMSGKSKGKPHKTVDNNNNNATKKMKIKKVATTTSTRKSKNKKEEKPKALPVYLLQERLIRDDELSSNNNAEGSNAKLQERNILPIPSFREQNICPFELRRHRLARHGRELQKYVVCPLNCDQQVKKLFLRFHIQFECPRRYVSCYYEDCHSIFPFNEREWHERNICIVSKRRFSLLEEVSFLSYQNFLCQNLIYFFGRQRSITRW
jgi:hypothetical protein